MTRSWALVVALFAGAALADSSPGARAELLVPGTFHRDELTARAAGAWWALCKVGDAVSLRAANVKLARVPDEMAGGLGWRVTASGCDSPLALLRKLDFLREGPVATGSSSDEEIGPPIPTAQRHHRIAIAFGDRGATLEELDRRGRHVLRLREGARSQELFVGRPGSSAPEYESLRPLPRVLWAGDLDGDGQLDLLLELTPEDTEEHVLWLSSGAPAGDLVREAARFTVTGC